MTSFNCPSVLHLLLSLTPSPPPFLLPNRKKKQGKGKKRGSDDSDSDDVEVIKEWNTSSRGRNGEGRNRAEPVEERKLVIHMGALRAVGWVLEVPELHAAQKDYSYTKFCSVSVNDTPNPSLLCDALEVTILWMSLYYYIYNVREDY